MIESYHLKTLRPSAPNTPLELTPLRVEQDRRDFEGWNHLNCFPALSGRRSSAAGRSAAVSHSLPIRSPDRLIQSTECYNTYVTALRTLAERHKNASSIVVPGSVHTCRIRA